MRARISLMLPLICAPLAFWGCVDDSGSNSSKADEPSNSLGQVDSEDDLPNCTEKKEDSLVVIRDSLSGFRCHNKKWTRYDIVAENEEDLPNCSKSREGFVAYIIDDENVLSCEEGKWFKDDDVVDESSSSDKTEASSSSSVESSSSAKSSSSSSAKSSSSVASSSSAMVRPAEIKESDYYKTNCPAGKVCTYAPTEQLNPVVTYGEILDERDYQVYKTVTIGKQTWMAQNLNYAYTGVKYQYEDSEGKIYTSDSTSWCYNNVADSCAKYGRLYTWAAAIDSVALASDAYSPQTCGYGKTCSRLNASALAAKPIQGVCPSGWHLPSDAEWNALFTAVGGIGSAGDSLKSTSGWYDSGNGEDSFGFSALPAGFRLLDGNFKHDDASFWSAQQYLDYAYGVGLNDGYEFTSQGGSPKYFGFSVRCIKD